MEEFIVALPVSPGVKKNYLIRSVLYMNLYVVYEDTWILS